MMYILKTERTAQGKLVFSREKHGKKVMFLAKDENGNVSVVDSEWVWEHEYDIINLGVSGTTLYPVKLSKYFLRCEACGKPFSIDDKSRLYCLDTLDDIDICPECYKHGCWIDSERYTVCKGCGEESDHCLVSLSQLVVTVDGRSICKESAESLGLDYCENCNRYYYPDYDNCPKCHSEED